MNKGRFTNPRGTGSTGPGEAKAWVKFKYTSTYKMQLLARYNVAQVIYNGVGDYTVVFQTPFQNPHYVVMVNAISSTAGNTATACINFTDTGAVDRKRIIVQQTGAANTDETEVHFVAFGDQS